MSLPDVVDVLVIGFGPAGASAAIAAHDAGARVVVVETATSGGGNCVHSGGFIFEIDDAVAVDHLDALCFGLTGRDVLAAYAAGLHAVPEWLAALGGATAPCDPGAFGGMLPSWPHFPGGGHVHYRQFVDGGDQTPGRALWSVLEAGVRQRGIPVLFGASTRSLLVGVGEGGGSGAGGGAVSGAVIDTPGGERTVRATGGVVLACGSFESDPALREAYLPLPLDAVGHAGNTGDGLRFAAQAGAALWHMSAFFGWFAFRHPDHAAAFPLDVHAPSYLYVDADGRRFADETGWEAHDRVRCISAFLPRRPNHPHLPGYVVFDERARLAGPLNGIVGTPNDYVWSADNSAEVDAGWITRAASAEALARAIGVDPVTLCATLSAYDAAAAAGRDDEFGRSPQTLVALQPPLYAIEMRPAVATASGGPRRDARARVLRPDGEPVPGLYAAGAAGSVWAHLTEHGGGLTDAIVFGRLAGAEAARAAGG